MVLFLHSVLPGTQAGVTFLPSPWHSRQKHQFEQSSQRPSRHAPHCWPHRLVRVSDPPVFFIPDQSGYDASQSVHPRDAPSTPNSSSRALCDRRLDSLMATPPRQR